VRGRIRAQAFSTHVDDNHLPLPACTTWTSNHKTTWIRWRSPRDPFSGLWWEETVSKSEEALYRMADSYPQQSRPCWFGVSDHFLQHHLAISLLLRLEVLLDLPQHTSSDLHYPRILLSVSFRSRQHGLWSVWADLTGFYNLVLRS
jgi:hypothetical protein